MFYFTRKWDFLRPRSIPERLSWSLRQEHALSHPCRCYGRSPTDEACADQGNPSKRQFSKCSERPSDLRNFIKLHSHECRVFTWMTFMGSTRLWGFLAIKPPTPPYCTSRLGCSWQISSKSCTKFSFTSTFCNTTQMKENMPIFIPKLNKVY